MLIICYKTLAKPNLVASIAMKGLLTVLSIKKEMGLIDLANSSCNYHKRYYISTSKQISNRCSKFICQNQLMR